MIQALPTLVLKAEDTDGFFFLDGQPASRSGSAVRVPAPGYGEHCLQFFPLSTNDLPVTLGVNFANDSFQVVPNNAAQVVRWPDNVWEIRLLPTPRPAPASPFPRILDGCALPWDGGVHATLFWENALYIAIENEQGTLLLGEHLSDECTSGRLQVVPRTDASELLLIQSDQAPGICALVRFEKQPELYFCEPADSCSLETDDCPLLVCVHDLKDLAGHQLQTCITLDKALSIRREVGFFSNRGVSPANEHELVSMFLDAVMLKLEKEASGYLSPSLRDNYPLSVLQEYLGDFTAFSLPPYTLQADDERLVFGLHIRYEKEMRARIFEFEIIQASEVHEEKFLINNIKEKCSWFE